MEIKNMSHDLAERHLKGKRKVADSVLVLLPGEG